MNRLPTIVMLTLLVFPMLLPWMPAELGYALHNQAESHHLTAPVDQASASDRHHDSGHAHSALTTHHSHHTPGLDFVTYIQDYLHADLYPHRSTGSDWHLQKRRHFEKYTALNYLELYEAEYFSSDLSRAEFATTTHPGKRPLFLTTLRIRV